MEIKSIVERAYRTPSSSQIGSSESPGEIKLKTPPQLRRWAEGRGGTTDLSVDRHSFTP